MLNIGYRENLTRDEYRACNYYEQFKMQPSSTISRAAPAQSKITTLPFPLNLEKLQENSYSDQSLSSAYIKDQKNTNASSIDSCPKRHLPLLRPREAHRSRL